jgi:hypothetical protein
MEIDRVMTRPRGKSPSAKEADVVFAMPAVPVRRKRYRVDSADRDTAPAATGRPANASRPNALHNQSSRISVEHRRDLLDVDPFLGYAKIVIRHHDCDRVVGRPERAPEQSAQQHQNCASNLRQ